MVRDEGDWDGNIAHEVTNVRSSSCTPDLFADHSQSDTRATNRDIAAHGLHVARCG